MHSRADVSERKGGRRPARAPGARRAESERRPRARPGRPLSFNGTRVSRKPAHGNARTACARVQYARACGRVQAARTQLKNALESVLTINGFSFAITAVHAHARVRIAAIVSSSSFPSLALRFPLLSLPFFSDSHRSAVIIARSRAHSRTCTQIAAIFAQSRIQLPSLSFSLSFSLSLSFFSFFSAPLRSSLVLLLPSLQACAHNHTNPQRQRLELWRRTTRRRRRRRRS